MEINDLRLKIVAGDYDEHLETIQRACKQRLRMRFRRHQRVKLVGTSNVELEGCLGTVEKVNQKTVSVLVDGHGGFLVPPRMLEAV